MIALASGATRQRFIERPVVTAVILAVVFGASSAAFAAEQTSAPGNAAPKVERTCGAVVTVEAAAAIQTQIAQAMPDILANPANAAEGLANAATAAVQANAVVTPECPCAENTVSFAVATTVQQAQAAGLSEEVRAAALEMVKGKIVQSLQVPEMCVASALGDATQLAQSASGATAATGSGFGGAGGGASPLGTGAIPLLVDRPPASGG